MASEPASPGKGVTLFLSYARADEARARSVARALENCGYTVWWDALIEGGAAFSRSIAEALDHADAVIVLWSQRSVDSDWVRDEAAQGREKHRLVPLSLDGSLPPLGFRQYQIIDLSRWRGRQASPEVESIERAIAKMLGRENHARLPSRQHMSRRSAIVAGTATVALIGGSAAWLASKGRLFGSGAGALTIAVMPFRNLSGDKEESYFSDGLTEEIRTALTRITALHVLAGTSSEKAFEAGGDATTVASALGVGFLLNGSVQRSGDVVRIGTDLIDGRTGFSRWSQSVDRKLTDIFAVQSDIARLVAQAMSIEVATVEPAPGGTRDVAAYEHYLHGRALFNLAKDEASDRQGLAEFELATAADPDFALAHAARSRSLAALAAEYAKADQLQSMYAEAIVAARRAVALAPELAEAHLALGFVLFAGKLDTRNAWPSYQKAYQLGRGNADILLLYALFCSRVGRPSEARAAVERAVTLDLLNARAFRAEGSVAYAARRFADAMGPLKHALQLNPKMTYAHALIGSALLGLGRLNDAKAEFEAEPEAQFRLSGLAIVNRKLGDDAGAEAAFADLVSQVGDSALYQQAEVLAQWGRAGDALARLQRARAVGDSGLIYVASDPFLDPLRQDAQFGQFLKSLASA